MQNLWQSGIGDRQIVSYYCIMIRCSLFLIIFLSCHWLAAQTEIKFAGLGLHKTGNAITVGYKLVGAPAAEAPLYYGDTVVAFNGKKITGMTLDEAQTLMYRIQDDSMVVTIRNRGIEENLVLPLATVADIKLRRASIIKEIVMRGEGLPLVIPTYTNWGFVFEHRGQRVYSDDIEFLPGGLIVRTTKRNRENISATETYEQTVNEILLPNLAKLNFDYSFTRFKQLGFTIDGTYYFEGEKTKTSGYGGDERFVFNNKGEQVFAYGGLHDRNIYNGTRPIDIVCGGQHIFGLQQNVKPFKWALFDKNQKQLTAFEFNEVKEWDGPGALVLKGDKWKIVVPEGSPVIGEGPWPFRDQNSRLFGYADHKGKVVGKVNFTSAGSFRDGLAPAMQGGLWGFINTKMQWVIPAQYAKLGGNFSSGLTSAKLSSGKWIYINTQGKQALPGEFLEADGFYDGRYAYVMTSDSMGMIIDNIGNTILGFTEPAKGLSVSAAGLGLFKVKSRGITYYKDIFDVAHLRYDFAKGRLPNPDDIRVTSERETANRQREQAWNAQKAQRERQWEEARTKSANEATAEKESPYSTCSKCNGSGYMTVIGSKTINGKKYYDSKVHYVDAYGIASRNYFTLNCSECKGKGTVKK